MLLPFSQRLVVYHRVDVCLCLLLVYGALEGAIQVLDDVMRMLLTYIQHWRCCLENVREIPLEVVKKWTSPVNLPGLDINFDTALVSSNQLSKLVPSKRLYTVIGLSKCFSLRAHGEKSPSMLEDEEATPIEVWMFFLLEYLSMFLAYCMVQERSICFTMLSVELDSLVRRIFSNDLLQLPDCIEIPVHSQDNLVTLGEIQAVRLYLRLTT